MEAKRDLLLVGSIPYDTAEQVFETFGTSLGDRLIAIPDGEVGPRKHWISRVHYQVFAGHPQIDVVRRPAPENGVERLNPRSAQDSWLFKVKEGVDRVRFGDPGWRLGFARDAVSSYFVFKTLRRDGKLPPGVRFQVSIASVNSLVPPRVFPDVKDLERIKPGLEEALVAEVAKIVELIPNEDLAIQWDCATEVQDAYGAAPGLDPATAIERNADQARRLSAHIPSSVMLGYHLCFGTLGGWPRFAPDDLSRTVDLANAMIAASGRKVDWIHIPMLDRLDDAFYAPLARLQPRGARVFLGAIHHMDTFEQRISLARKFIKDFGVAGYCGFGRLPPSDLPALLQDHRTAASYCDHVH